MRGAFIQKRGRSERVPDIGSSEWAYNSNLHNMWKQNWEATGDSARHESYGPAPLGWSSFAQSDINALLRPKPPASGLVCNQASQYDTWSRRDYGATCLQTTVEPLRARDGSTTYGPPWPKVVRRITYDLHSGIVLEDIATKGLSLVKARGCIPGSCGRPRDIVTQFFFRPGKRDHGLDGVSAMA